MRARLALIVGITLLLTVVGAALYSAASSDARSKLDLATQPPQLPVLQRLLWKTPVRDQVQGMSSFVQQQLRDTTVFRSVPLTTARLGKPYRYQPIADEAIVSYRIAEGPPGLQIDAETGVVTGRPEKEGKHNVAIEAQLASGANILHSYPLFVDSRFAPLGSDAIGMNLLRLLAAAAEATLWPSVVAVILGVGGGLVIGAYAGYYPGAVRSMGRGTFLSLQSIPAFLLLYLAAVASSFDIRVIMLVVGVILLPETGGVFAERVARFRATDFVEAARELGMSDRAILWNEIVWHNLRPLLVARTAQAFAFAILADVTLGYLQLIDPHRDSLGVLLYNGREAVAPLIGSGIAIPWWLVVVPIAALILTISSLSMIEYGVLARWERTR